jgi:hypothetical protein
MYGTINIKVTYFNKHQNYYTRGGLQIMQKESKKISTFEVEQDARYEDKDHHQKRQ